MTYKKLTYSGTTVKNRLYFYFEGDYFDTELITQELEIEPTSVSIKKEPIPKSTSWEFWIHAGDEPDLESKLSQLIELFEPKIDIINRLKESLNAETGIMFVIDIDINPEASTPYFGFNQRTIRFLNSTNSRVDFDIYKSDTIGLLGGFEEE